MTLNSCKDSHHKQTYSLTQSLAKIFIAPLEIFISRYIFDVTVLLFYVSFRLETNVLESSDDDVKSRKTSNTLSSLLF